MFWKWIFYFGFNEFNNKKKREKWLNNNCYIKQVHSIPVYFSHTRIIKLIKINYYKMNPKSPQKKKHSFREMCECVCSTAEAVCKCAFVISNIIFNFIFAIW